MIVFVELSIVECMEVSHIVGEGVGKGKDSFEAELEEYGFLAFDDNARA